MKLLSIVTLIASVHISIYKTQKTQNQKSPKSLCLLFFQIICYNLQVVSYNNLDLSI